MEQDQQENNTEELIKQFQQIAERIAALEQSVADMEVQIGAVQASTIETEINSHGLFPGRRG